jgi:serine/threonine-protein kinase RsbT
MMVLSKEAIAISKEQDVILFRNRVREMATRIGMGIVNQTMLLTAASELVRNMLKYGNGGKVVSEIVSVDRKSGVKLTFEDKGPGIKDVAQAMKDGYSTGRSLGLGLPGAKRLVSEFDIKSTVGKGTTVTIIKWKNG